MVDLNQFDSMRLNLELLAEECGEIVQMKSKIIRYGVDDVYHGRGVPNRQGLINEIGDLFAVVDILKHHGLFTGEQVAIAKNQKLQRLEIHYHKDLPEID